jgi:hypothetical protein
MQTIAETPIGPDSSLRKHPRLRSVRRVQAVAWMSALATPGAVIAALIADELYWPLRLLLPLFVVGTVALLADAWARAWFARYSAQRLPDGLLVRRGVFWRSETFVPDSRIQHTEVNQGPLDRRWDMATLSVFTGGSYVSSIGVPGLFRDDAIALRDQLLGRHGSDAL